LGFFYTASVRPPAGENVLDEEYAEAFGFSAPGIAGYGGIKLTL
jgi:hypothetical protein